jgi:gliding motility-associated lipoprotein GldH
MNSVKGLVVAFLVISLSVLSGCINNSIADVNVSMPKHRWSYINKVVATADIKDHTKTYDLFFRLRHTAQYQYSNIFILLRFKLPGKREFIRRYEFKLAEADGRWLGAGSGDLFTYTLPLLDGYSFPANGKYTLVIEQCMRDNPLHGVSDAGLVVMPHNDQVSATR